MAMKKKFLGLALAAAVALPATSVYAAGENNIINGVDTQTYTQNVTVTGEVKSNQGTVAEGRLEVVLPTSLAFSVDQKGNFTNVDYSVTNNSPCAITVGVQQFTETNTSSTDGIILKNKDENMTSLDRNNVKMALVGDNGGSGSRKRYVDLGADSTQSLVSPEEILDVPSNQTKVIQLLGDAGKVESSVTNGTNETFTVVFSVKKK
nr:hypothetical protein [uncultured Romboutsia sp.]